MGACPAGGGGGGGFGGRGTWSAFVAHLPPLQRHQGRFIIRLTLRPEGWGVGSRPRCVWDAVVVLVPE